MSGSTIGGVLGAAIGYWVGGARGAQVGWMIGSAVGGYVDPDIIAGQRLTDAQTQTAAEGAPRPIIYGTSVVAGNVIHCGPLEEHKHSERTGKGGPVQESYTYTRTHAIRVCEGPIGNISRIWRDDKLVYDVRDPAQWPEQADAIRNMQGDTAKFATGITIYTGSETQLPDPALEALPTENGGGVGEVCAYRGTCYVVFTDDDLTDRQGSIPNYRFEVSCCGTSTTTTPDVGWVAGNTGILQSVFSAAIHNATAITAGWNDNLRRTTDGGVSWNAVDYVTSTGWDPALAIEAVWHVEDGTDQGIWYIAKSDQIAVSYSAGFSFTNYITPVHTIVGRIGPGGGVHLVNGVYMAGAGETTNTVIFEPLNLGDTDVDLGADYGRATAIGDLGGTRIVGTDIGKIVSIDGTVRYTDPSSRVITQFTYGDGVALACLASAGILRSTDGGTNWTYDAIGTTGGIVWARGRFYRSSSDYIYASDDLGLTWYVVDDSFLGSGAGSMIVSDGYSVLAITTGGNDTAALPSLYVLPDVAGGIHLDAQGNIVADSTTAVDRCVAQLDEIVTDICERVGLTAAQVDVSQLAGIDVRGFVIGQQMAAADALRSLQQYYFFDLPEWGDYTDTGTKLRAILRGGASLFAITDDDLVESDDDEDTRAQAVEFPRKINLVTSDVDSDYNPTKQTFERRTDNVKAVGETSFTLPVVTIRTEAAKAVDIMGKVAWEEALGRNQFILPEEFSRLTPSDCFTKDSKRWRAEKCEYGDGTVNVEAVRDRVSAYTSVATPGDAPAPSVPPSTLRGPTVFAAMNLPSLRTADNVPGMYIAVTGLLDGWIGCDLQLSVDEGASYQSVATIRSEATMGSLVADCDSGATDLITTTVLHGHELDSVTTAQIAARANGFAVLTNAVAEIGQFQTATETATDGTYDLTDLTRGELGTTAAAHNAGDRFVLLDGAVTFLPLDVSLAGRTLWFRPVSLGTAAANNAVYQVVFNPIFTSAETIDFRVTESGDTRITESGEYRLVD